MLLYKKTTVEDTSTAISQQISLELLEKLNLFHNFNPTTILEIGCGRGYCLGPLQKAYPEARYFGLENSYERLVQAKMHASQWVKHSPTFLLGDIEKLQFVDQQFDLICSNLALLWVHNLEQCLFKLQKMLKANGLLIFTTLGLNTFKEFKIHKDTVIGSKVFVELHHLGDLIMQQKLSDVIVETDYWDIRYNNFYHAHQEIKKMGLDSLISDRKAITYQPDLDLEYTDISITWEIIYAQAWRLPPQKEFSSISSQEISIPLQKIYKR